MNQRPGFSDMHRRGIINLCLCADGVTLFKLDIKTQAGTYIKEFVHGDFGRTQPSLGQLLGGVQVDILALDVQVVCQDTFLLFHGASTLIHAHICNCYQLLKYSYTKLIAIKVIQKFDFYISIVLLHFSYLYGFKMNLHSACPALQSMFASTHTTAFRSKYALPDLIERTKKMQPCSRIYYSNVS
jgi:hypothetical protein